MQIVGISACNYIFVCICLYFIYISVCEKENVGIALCGWFGVGLRDRGGVDYCMCR